MRIGYVLRYWPTLSETFVAREIEALQARGVQVDVVAMGWRRDPRRGHAVSALPVFRPPRGQGWMGAVPGLSASVTDGHVRRFLRDPVAGMRAKDALRVVWLARLARQRGWDRIHAHFAGEAAAWAQGASRLTGLRYSVTVHGSDLFVPRPDLEHVLRDASPVISVCRHHRRWLLEHHGLDSVVVRCGVDPDRYPSQVDPRWDWVCVARDVPKKGLDDLAWAVGRVGGILRLVSDAVRLGGPRVVVGPVEAAAVPQVLARSRVFVLPCRVAPSGDRDGVPVALMEAMAVGLPVVTTDVSGIGELVDPQVGWIAPSDDRQGLAEVLQGVRADVEEQARRGAAGRVRIRQAQWTVSRQAAELATLWHGA